MLILNQNLLPQEQEERYLWENVPLQAANRPSTGRLSGVYACTNRVLFL